MATETAPERNEAKAQAFAEKMLGVLNGAGLALMTSIGHRTKLFDVMAGMPPATSQEIAAGAGLQERYVREWLGAMVTGGIVEYDAGNRHYWLPQEHAGFLTRGAGSNNMASTAQWISVLGQVEGEVVERFVRGGGVPYSCFCRFHEVMAEESAQTVVGALFDHILPLVPGLLEQLARGIDVLDVGCGAGRAINALAAAFPRSRFSGYDFSDEGIALARTEANDRGLTNVRFEVRDAAAIGERASYDLITAFDAIHDQAKPAKVLAEIASALRPNGTFLMQDIAGSSYVEKNIGRPIAPLVYTISCMHCMTVSLANGGAGLGAAWGEELATSMLHEAGFRNVQTSTLPHDILNNYYVARLQ